MNKQVLEVFRRLEEAGHQVYFVGGCVRDGMGSGDIDATTSASPDEMKATLEGYRIIETGIKHGTLTVLVPDGDEMIPVEITTFRVDGGYSDARHPDQVSFVRSIEEDLARRDFTMNAMAMDARGEIIDLFGGREDLERGLIRAIGDPDRRFREDALRIMRGLRFAACLGTADKPFSIEEETAAAMMRNRQLLAEISAERILTELRKLLMGVNAGNVIRQYVDVLEPVLPELVAMKGFLQHNNYHKYDVLEHCIRTMESIDGQGRDYMKLAALFHDVGKPETFFMGDDGQGHFYGHPAAGAEIMKGILTRLKADSFTIDRVTTIVKYHDLLFDEKKPLLKKWLGRFGQELLEEILDIKLEDNRATGNMPPYLEDKFERVRGLIREIIEENECFSLKDLAVKGQDLQEFMEPGPDMGRVLNGLLDLVIEGEVPNHRDALMAKGREIYGEEKR